MRRVTTRLLLAGATLAGLAGLGVGVASLTAAPASASIYNPAAVHLVAATPSATTSPAATGSKNCPANSRSSTGTSSYSAT